MAPEFRALSPLDSFEPRPTIAHRLLRRFGADAGPRAEHLSCLRERLSRANIRLIYANTVATGRIVEFLSFLQCPVICHVHELEDTISTIGPENIALLRKHVSSYLAVSEAVRTNLIDNHGIPGQEIEVIHGFVPTLLAGDEAIHEDVRSKLKIPSHCRLVCAVGSLDRRKGVDVFLDVARDVARFQAGTPVHFVWVGGRPDLLPEVRKAVKNSALRDFVHFVGPKSDVRPYYRACDLLLLPSREDPFPLVMMEAGLFEKPTVCFAGSGGAPEFVAEDAGVIVPRFDASEMARSVASLLADEIARRRLGSNAKQKVLARHSLEKTGQRIAATLRKSLNGLTPTVNAPVMAC